VATYDQADDEAVGRSKSLQHLKELALALHNYHNSRGTFPPAYNTSPDGKPLLSWRVHLLPFLKQEALHNEFHLDEPWDSEHNMTLISRMPDLFQCTEGGTESGKTRYLGVGGKGGVFPGNSGIGFKDILDGTFNTIMVVEVNEPSAVIWTKPDDFVPDAGDPREGLLGSWQGGFLAAFADGSAEFIRENVDSDSLLSLFARNSGKQIDRKSL
jgi:hypothetical protein